jgi:hypothetical protein
MTACTVAFPGGLHLLGYPNKRIGCWKSSELSKRVADNWAVFFLIRAKRAENRCKAMKTHCLFVLTLTGGWVEKQGPGRMHGAAGRGFIPAQTHSQ